MMNHKSQPVCEGLHLRWHVFIILLTSLILVLFDNQAPPQICPAVLVKSPANTMFISAQSHCKLRIFHKWLVILKGLFTLCSPSKPSPSLGSDPKALLGERWVAKSECAIVCFEHVCIKTKADHKKPLLSVCVRSHACVCVCACVCSDQFLLAVWLTHLLRAGYCRSICLLFL